MKAVAGGMVALVLSISWGIARWISGEVSAAPATVKDVSEPTAEVLRNLLRAREAELEALRLKVRELEAIAEKELYRQAEALGIVAAVSQSELPERQQRRIAIAIVRESRENGLDPLLVVALIRAESSFDNYAQSKVGAMGLMQVMPQTGKWIASLRGKRLARKTHLFDSELNVEIGTAYLANLIRRFGALDAALVAYNAGPSAARRILADRSSRPRFLGGYPRKVVREFQRLKARVDSSERAAASAAAASDRARG
jgi:soluble lytic murein transglycosylase